MSEEIEKLKNPSKKKTVRYFSDVKKEEPTEVQHIQVNINKKAESFKGEVIQVDGRERFYGKTKWRNKRPEKINHKLLRRNKKMVQIKIDPYAYDRHSRKYNDFCRIPPLQHDSHFNFIIPL